MRKNLNIKIPISISTNNALMLRYSIVDTIEERGIGDVVNEGMAEDYMDIDVEVEYLEKTKKEIESILIAMGCYEQCELIYSDLD